MPGPCPRCRLPVTPEHCSWLNQIEQGGGLLPHQRLRCSTAGNAPVDPVRWTTAAFATVLAGRGLGPAGGRRELVTRLCWEY